MDYTAEYTDAELLQHGRMRVLRMLRNQHARQFRAAVEGIHTEMLHALRGLDANVVHQPINTVKVRALYRQARDAERHMLAIDRQREEIEGAR